MAKQTSQAELPAQDSRLTDLAKAIYLRIVTGPASVASTNEHLANEAFDRAAAFYAVADTRKEQ